MKTIITFFAAILITASVSDAGMLVAVDSNRNLYEIDMTTGAKTLIGVVSANAATTAGLAYDRATGTIYLTSTGNDSVYELDLATGTATLIGAYGDAAIVMHGLEWDSSTGTLYGVSSHNNGLYSISTTTGAATLIGTSPLTSFTNLGYNSDTGVMYATNSATPENFYSMDLATGTPTLIGPLSGPLNPNGLAYDWDNGLMYMVDNNTDTLYTIDMGTGLATGIGSTGTGNLLGLVYIPEPATLAAIGLAALGLRRRRARPVGPNRC
jgi:DNA-binding beta-propeller fold protein YncE